MYLEGGVSKEVLSLADEVLGELSERFERIDRIAEYNQLKVLGAMRKNRVDSSHFAATTGYGYNDAGRDTLEKVYGIEEGRVLHIHGRAASGDELIVGHNNPARMPRGMAMMSSSTIEMRPIQNERGTVILNSSTTGTVQNQLSPNSPRSIWPHHLKKPVTMPPFILYSVVSCSIHSS